MKHKLLPFYVILLHFYIFFPVSAFAEELRAPQPDDRNYMGGPDDRPPTEIRTARPQIQSSDKKTDNNYRDKYKTIDPNLGKYLDEMQQIRAKLKKLTSAKGEAGSRAAIERLRELANIKEHFASKFLQKQEQIYYQLKEQKEYATTECESARKRQKTVENLKRIEECEKGQPELNRLSQIINKQGEEAVELLKSAEQTRKDADAYLKELEQGFIK